MMLLPCVVFFIIFSYVPLAGIIIAFKDYGFSKGILRSPWADQFGMQNFIDFFRYYDSSKLIRNTFIMGFVKAVIAFPFPILFALLLNEVVSTKFKRAVQTISYLPYFISWVIVSIMIFRILAPDDGIVNLLAGALGMKANINYLMERDYFYPIIFISHLWKNVGWSSIIYLAAIASIDPGLYEAAKIDGAGKLRQVWHITLPSIKLTMGILFILALGALVTSGFEQNYLLRTPGNMEYADILDTYVLRQGFEQGNYAYAAAVGILQGIVALVMIVISNRMSRKYLEASIW